MRPGRGPWLPGLAAAFLSVAVPCCTGGVPPAHPERPAAVAWAPWSAETFAAAQRTNRPILIDVVAGWCHWCHVMDAETYANPEVAALIGEHFVAIRVDSDARPDVAERYERWGWPATVVLTPDARPVLERRGFQPAPRMLALLGAVVADHAAGRPIARVDPPSPPPRAPADLTDLLAPSRTLLDRFWDPGAAGWGQPQKVPWPGPVEEALLRARLRDDAAARTRALQALSAYERLIDPVWGGMSQYSVGGGWDRPHFEKIAAVQAGAIRAFARAAQATGDARWLSDAQRVREYVDTFLRAPDGAFWASQDADLSSPSAVDGHEYYALDAAGRRRLGLPRIDRHVYADLDGELAEALAILYAASGDAGALDDARRAADRVLRTHTIAPGALRHDDAASPSTIVHLSDEVAMGRALLALHAADGSPRWLEAAAAIGRFVRERLQDASAGGFWSHTADPDAVGVFAERRKPFTDNVAAVRLLLELSERTGDAQARSSALRAIAALGPRAAEGGVAAAELIVAIEEAAARRVRLTVVGPPGDQATADLHRAALASYEPRAIVVREAPGEHYPDLGRPALYLCDDRSCSRPLTSASELPAALCDFLTAEDGTGRPPGC